jgi:hypothetical protein
MIRGRLGLLHDLHDPLLDEALYHRARSSACTRVIGV